MKDLFTSKKFWVSIAGLVLMILSRFVEINVEEALGIISPLIAYVLGQGIADLGKAKAKIETD